jgi:ABC-type nitrate/sulfonate/bicarbonate transport system substrate-binding protein
MLLASVVVILAACGQSPSTASSGTSGTPGAPESKVLKIGVDGLPDFSNEGTDKWAMDLKAKYGIDAQIIDLGSTVGPFRALVAGDVDVLVDTDAPGVSLIMQGNDLRMIAAADRSSDYVLLSTPDIKKPSDLIGKKVGTQGPASASQTLAKAALKHAGLDTSKIDFVQVGGTSARIAAMVSGQIQAGAAHAPDAYNAQDKSGLNILLPMAQVLPTYEFHILWAKQSWLSSHPNLAQIAVNVFVDSTRWEADNKQGYIDLSKQNVEGLTDDERSKAYDLFKKVNYFALNGGMDIASIRSTIAVEQETGGLPASGVPDPSKWADASYVNRYLAANGKR